jgi:glycosyltransferase involved in cell wall biosynthesis
LGVLLEALAALRNDGVPARLLIIGGSAGSSDPSNAEYQAEIQARIEQRELRPFVHSTGFVDEETVANYLTASDVVVLPFQDGASFRRGSLMAAIQYGCAVVTTQPTVSIPDFINGENMLLVERESSKAVADAVLHLWHETELRLKLQRGAQALSSRFQWPQIARETISCYERVIGAKA